MQARERQIAELQGALRAALSAGRLESATAAAVAAREATFALYGRHHPASASAINNEALVAKQRGDLARSLELYREALGLYERLVGTRHRSYAAACANLGLAHCAAAAAARGVDAMGHADAARGHLETALAVRSAELPAGDPLIAMTRYQLASALRLGKHHAEAEVLLTGALTELRALLGSEHPTTATALNNLGFLLKDMRQYERATEAYAEATRIRVAALGEAHHDTLVSMHNLAECRRAAGDEEGALTVQDRILAITQAAGAPESTERR